MGTPGYLPETETRFLSWYIHSEDIAWAIEGAASLQITASL